jgi:hypothetical protein
VGAPKGLRAHNWGCVLQAVMSRVSVTCTHTRVSGVIHRQRAQSRVARGKGACTAWNWHAVARCAHSPSQAWSRCSLAAASRRWLLHAQAMCGKPGHGAVARRRQVSGRVREATPGERRVRRRQVRLWRANAF